METKWIPFGDSSWQAEVNSETGEPTGWNRLANGQQKNGRWWEWNDSLGKTRCRFPDGHVKEGIKRTSWGAVVCGHEDEWAAYGYPTGWRRCYRGRCRDGRFPEFNNDGEKRFRHPNGHLEYRAR